MKVINYLFLITFYACSTTDGLLDATKNERTVKKRRENYQQCFRESDSYLAKEKGKVTLKFNIDKELRAKNIKVIKSTFKDANFHACLEMITRDTIFTEASSKPIEQTLYFRP